MFFNPFAPSRPTFQPLPLWLITHDTKPEQSKEVEGELPPQTMRELSLKDNLPRITVTMEVTTPPIYVQKTHKGTGKATYDDIIAYVLEKHGIRVSTINIACVKEKYGLLVRRHWVENPKAEQCPPYKVAPIADALKHFGIIPDEEG